MLAREGLERGPRGVVRVRTEGVRELFGVRTQRRVGRKNLYEELPKGVVPRGGGQAEVHEVRHRGVHGHVVILRIEREQLHPRAAEEFEQQLGTFSRFVEATGDYVPYLIRKAERVEEYQQQR